MYYSHHWLPPRTPYFEAQRQKAGHLKRGKKLEKIHDLILLGKSVRLPKRLLNYCKEITAAYIYTRYPGLPRSKDMQKNSKNFIRQTEEILRWIKKRL